MGWLFQNDKLRHQTPAEYITRAFTHDNETTAATVITAAAVGGTIYVAIRNHDKTTGKSYVFCGVILFKNNERDGFGYKDMDESMGPCEVDCPDRIMRLLSPIEEIPNPGYAAEWRKSVAAAKAKKAETRSKPSATRLSSPTQRISGRVASRRIASRSSAFTSERRSSLRTSIRISSAVCARRHSRAP
jgi:hypothetical protein